MSAPNPPAIPGVGEKPPTPGEFDLIGFCLPFTMAPPTVVLNAIRAAESIAVRGIPGAVVECGVWRGGASMAMALRLQSLGQARDFFLYDTFDGMSEPTADDTDPAGLPAAQLLQNSPKDEHNHIWAYAPFEKVRQNFESTGYPGERLHFIQGKVEDTIPATLPEKIALLRLDTDWYASTKHELAHLYPLLESGGVLILDDYGYWSGAKKAADEYFRESGLGLHPVPDGYSNSAHWMLKP